MVAATQNYLPISRESQRNLSSLHDSGTITTCQDHRYLSRVPIAVAAQGVGKTAKIRRTLGRTRSVVDCCKLVQHRA